MKNCTQFCSTRHLVAEEVTVFITVDLLVVLKDTMAGTGTHEVVITLTGRQTAAHGRPRLATPLATLQRKETICFKSQPPMMTHSFNYSCLWLWMQSSQAERSLRNEVVLTKKRPLATALCTRNNAPLTSCTSADQMQQFTWAHSFWPTYSSLPASYKHLYQTAAYRRHITMYKNKTTNLQWVWHHPAADKENSVFCPREFGWYSEDLEFKDAQTHYKYIHT